MRKMISMFFYVFAYLALLGCGTPGDKDGDLIADADDCNPDIANGNPDGSDFCPDGRKLGTGVGEGEGEGEGEPSEGEGEGEGEGEDVACNDDNDCQNDEFCQDNECVAFACERGQTRSCNTGLDGVCAQGQKRCLDDRTDFGPCEVTTGPGELDEVCNNGRDEDCDGRPDNGCACTAGEVAECVLPGVQGDCRIGRMVCLPDGSQFGSCEQVTFSQPEICFNGRDEACNGSADDTCTCVPGQTQACNTTLSGVCAQGIQTCRFDGGGFDQCQPLIAPFSQEDTCGDGIDQDCDGLPDSGCACEVGETISCVVNGEDGPCSVGVAECLPNGNGFGACVQTTFAQTEVCGDRIDQSCDGVADEGCGCVPNTTRVCSTGLSGVCSQGVETCLPDGSDFGSCEVLTSPSVEQCNDGLDQDCDGSVDNGCTCRPGAVTSCALPNTLGACVVGEATCLPDGSRFGVCRQVTFTQTEVCSDAIDNDCDGAVNDGCVCVPGTVESCQTGLLGVCGTGTHTCLPGGEGFTDCEVLTVPQPETCGDGVDQDCNGLPDNGCACAPGSTIACNVTGANGPCSVGTATCSPSGNGFGTCVQTIQPVNDICTDQIDNDCDGQVDEDCACVPFQRVSCDTGLQGACSTGVRECEPDGSQFSPCEVLVTPQPEACGDGVDQDCNGLPDNGCACVPGQEIQCAVNGANGPCSVGTATCSPSGDQFGACVQTTQPETESCVDRIDNDCDGTVNDGCACTPGVTVSCSTNLPGVCGAGVQTCLPDGSDFTPCEVLNAPTQERCNDGVDRDCDGVIDNGCTCEPGTVISCPLSTLDGPCSVGEATCNPDGNGFSGCVQTVFPVGEICLNQIDDDCDGVPDDSCVCVPNSVQSCTTDLDGACSDGIQVCDSNGQGFGPCQVVILPLPETCNDGVDNDCDSAIDNGCTCDPGERIPCAVSGQQGPCAVGEAQCQLDGDGFGACVQTVQPTVNEVCIDGIDNNCNGLPDDSCSCNPGDVFACDTGLPGICSGGLQECVAAGTGFTPCEVLVVPNTRTDVCGNGLDEDCDGLPDDGCSCAPGSQVDCVVTGQEGVCKLGRATCASNGNGFGACLQTVLPAVQDICTNRLDDDCDGVADEGCVCQPFATQACSTGLSGVCSQGQQTCRADGSGFDVCEVLTVPGALTEVCGNTIDENCDGVAETCPDPGSGSTAGTATFDDDGDCFCESGTCTGTSNPTGCAILQNGDCNDVRADTRPGAPELCDGVDNDCNAATAIDAGCVVTSPDGDDDLDGILNNQDPYGAFDRNGDGLLETFCVAPLPLGQPWESADMFVLGNQFAGGVSNATGSPRVSASIVFGRTGWCVDMTGQQAAVWVLAFGSVLDVNGIPTAFTDCSVGHVRPDMQTLCSESEDVFCSQVSIRDACSTVRLRGLAQFTFSQEDGITP